MIRRRLTIITAGFLTLQVLVFGTIGVLLVGAIIGWGGTSHRAATRFERREEAFQIAEAGIEYYRWHLAHAPTDYEDGSGEPGPYEHDYLDHNGQKIGTFSLEITPPPLGSTVVTIVSTGRVLADPALERIIEAKLAIPSLAKYAVVANAKMRFGEGTEIFGAIHSNDGIRFDGLAHNIVSSAKENYDDPDHSGANEFGVHTHLRPPPQTGMYSEFVPAEAPPSAIADRSDVFLAGRQFPVPAVDFTGLTADLAQIKADAQAAGFYRGGSGGFGYRLVLKTNDSFDLYRVNSLFANPGGSCSNNSTARSQSGWGTWSIGTDEAAQTRIDGPNPDLSFPFPENGLIFLEDHLWLAGQMDGARLTIASGRFPDNPATRTSITVNNDLRYTNYDGTDTLSLIAQNNLNVGLKSEADLRLDGALVAQNGRVGRFYYNNSCGVEYVRSLITLYGMIATNQRYGFAYISGLNGEHVSGYVTRNIIYDGNLLYGPPPSFPLTADSYETISWREL